MITSKTRAGLFLLFSLFIQKPVYADQTGNFETVDLRASFQLDQGVTHSLPISDEWHYVQKAFIRIEAYRDDAVVEVYANGDHKSTIHIPARDPSYVVTIAESIKSLEFRHVNGGNVEITGIQVVTAKDYTRDEHAIDLTQIHLGDYPGVDHYLEQNEATALAQAALILVQGFQPLVDVETEYVRYLLPIKSVAGRLFAVSSATGVLGRKTRMNLRALAGQIDAAKPFIAQSLRRDLTFDLAVRIWALKAKIEDLLH